MTRDMRSWEVHELWINHRKNLYGENLKFQNIHQNEENEKSWDVICLHPKTGGKIVEEYLRKDVCYLQ